MKMTTPSENPFRLDGETALITGGGSGIGLGIARCMVQAGAKVVLVGRREEPLVAACAELGPMATFIAHDITRLEAAGELAAAACQAAQSPVTILVNNAGTHLKRFAADTTPEEFQSVLTTHVLAAHALTRAMIPGMVDRRKGSILFTSSMAAFMGVPQVLAYAAAKSAYFGMVSTLSAELAAMGVRANAIAPGWIFSAMTEKALDSDPARKAKVLSRIQMGRMGSPDDIGHAAVFLSSQAASYITGVTLPVDGGAAIGF
jgi:NAD(P)-dependent dehydrogenase (short-subunit alcohol dehydrogenase family)